MTNVFIYWDSGFLKMNPMIKYIYNNNVKMSKKFNFNLILLTDDNIKKYISLHPRFYNLAVNFKSDIIRFYILNKYGGIWLDTDIIIIKDLNILYQKLLNSSKYAILDVETKIGHEILGCCSLVMKPKTPFSIDCVKYVNYILNTKNDIHRVEIGPGTIWNLYNKHKYGIIVNSYDIIKHGCNFINWNDNPGYDKKKWYFKNKAKARHRAYNLLQNNSCFYVITWQIYRENDIKEDIVNFVFKDRKSVFSYLIK